MLLLAIVVVHSQNKNEERKERLRIASSKIKSTTQIAYEYVWDQKTGSKKPSTKGVKISTRVYDLKGNIVEEISYNQFGNVDSKTSYKYDGKGNNIELVVSNSDGSPIEESHYEFKRDTLSQLKTHRVKDNLTYSNFMWNVFEAENGNRVFHVFSYSSDDTTLVGSQRNVFDSKNNLITYYSYKGKYLNYKYVYLYNDKGRMIEIKFYNKQEEFTGSQKFKYDLKENLIETQNCGAYNIPYETTVYKNDPNGNVIEAIVYTDNDLKKPKALYKFNYEYYK